MDLAWAWHDGIGIHVPLPCYGLGGGGFASLCLGTAALWTRRPVHRARLADTRLFPAPAS